MNFKYELGCVGISFYNYDNVSLERLRCYDSFF